MLQGSAGTASATRYEANKFWSVTVRQTWAPAPRMIRTPCNAGLVEAFWMTRDNPGRIDLSSATGRVMSMGLMVG